MGKNSLSRYQLCVLLLLLTMAIVFGAITGIRKSHPGILLEGTVLSLSQGENGDATYSGKVRGDMVRVAVIPNEGNTDVLVHVNEEPIVTYKVTYPEGIVSYLGVDFPRIEISWDDNILFQGGYDPNPLFFGAQLRDAEGKPYQINAEDVDTPDSYPEIAFSVMTIYRFAQQHTDAVRGNWVTWFLMVLFSGVVVLDLYNPYAVYAIFPLFFGVAPDKEPSKRALKIRQGIMIAGLLVGYIRGIQFIDYI